MREVQVDQQAAIESLRS
jgi:hypothetical protein